MDFIHPPCLSHYLDPWDSRSHGFPKGRGTILACFGVMWFNVFVFFLDMGSSADMVEHMV
jgi:hypothetical protein